MKALIVTAGYSIFEAKGQLNGFLAYLTEKNLSEKGHDIKISNVTVIRDLILSHYHRLNFIQFQG